MFHSMTSLTDPLRLPVLQPPNTAMTTATFTLVISNPIPAVTVRPACLGEVGAAGFIDIPVAAGASLTATFSIKSTCITACRSTPGSSIDMTCLQNLSAADPYWYNQVTITDLTLPFYSQMLNSTTAGTVAALCPCVLSVVRWRQDCLCELPSYLGGSSSNINAAVDPYNVPLLLDTATAQYTAVFNVKAKATNIGYVSSLAVVSDYTDGDSAQTTIKVSYVAIDLQYPCQAVLCVCFWQ